MKCNSPMYLVGWVLLLVGGLNWGLVGLGTLLSKDLNVVNMLLGTWPAVEAVVYLLVGLAAVTFLFSYKKSTCCSEK